MLLKASENACAITREAIELGKELFERNWLEFKKAGDYKTNYIALTKNDSMEFYEGKIKVINPEGETLSELDAQKYVENIEEKRYEWTYAKFAYLKTLGWPNGIVQVGPTPRINVNKSAATEFANAEFEEFKRKFGNPAHATLLFDYARLIDLMYACERAREILEDESLTKEDVRVDVKPKIGRGVGVVEAPRGTLAHEYTLAKHGRLKSMKLLIPTQINNAAINLNVKDAAAEFIHRGEIKHGLLNRIEMVIRAYDPCIKCATRSVGENILVEIRSFDDKLLKML
jgi:F420-non-reducing hydrogenase large subunit